MHVCSLPRFKTSGAIKGFAFIEFATNEAADKAVEVIIVVNVISITIFCAGRVLVVFCSLGDW